MKPQNYSRRTRYRAPAAWYSHISNRLGVFLTSFGLAPKDAVTLEVSGRRTGRVRRIPLLRTPLRGKNYLVALAGESEWVRNVRAAGGQAVIRRRGARPVHLIELAVDERPPIIREYLRGAAERSGAKAAANAARNYFGLRADPSLEEIRAVADYYPVFRVAYGRIGSNVLAQNPGLTNRASSSGK